MDISVAHLFCKIQFDTPGILNSTYFTVIFYNNENDTFVPAEIKHKYKHNEAFQFVFNLYVLLVEWNARQNWKDLAKNNHVSSYYFVSVDVVRFWEKRNSISSWQLTQYVFHMGVITYTIIRYISSLVIIIIFHGKLCWLCR